MAEGNVQDMSVFDKEHPTLPPTEEGQDVESLAKIVVPMPAFTSPDNPMTLSGSINLPLDRHPVTHSEDYGQNVTPEAFTSDAPESPMAVGAMTIQEEGRKASDLPEDREEWQKSHWQQQARSLGVRTTGSLDQIRRGVEEHEEMQQAAEERGSELRGMSRDDLDKLAGQYDLDPSEYSRKEDLAEAILRAES